MVFNAFNKSRLSRKTLIPMGSNLLPIRASASNARVPQTYIHSTRHASSPNFPGSVLLELSHFEVRSFSGRGHSEQSGGHDLKFYFSNFK
jgi:hypothetical protein